jgi:hypothetical protein
MRALKALVIIMGVLIVVGTVALVAILISRVGGRVATGPAATGPAAPAKGFGTASIALPNGAVVQAMQGVGPHALVQVALPDGSHQLLVLDPGSGTLRGTIELRPAP